MGATQGLGAAMSVRALLASTPALRSGGVDVATPLVAAGWGLLHHGVIASPHVTQPRPQEDQLPPKQQQQPSPAGTSQPGGAAIGTASAPAAPAPAPSTTARGWLHPSSWAPAPASGPTTASSPHHRPHRAAHTSTLTRPRSSGATHAPAPAMAAPPPFGARGLQAAAASKPPGSAEPFQDPLSVAALAAGLWDEGGGEGLTPAAIVAALDRHIVGQAAAKRAVAVALRNRWRRRRVEPAEFRDEIMPKNILMVGPTGCGKTEVARRLAKLADAPFVKVEATKYTELGYVGRDVEEIIKDLVEAAVVLVRQRAKERLAAHTARRAENIILSAMLGPAAEAETLESFRGPYRQGELDSMSVEIEASLLESAGSTPGFGSGGRLDFGPGGTISLEKLIVRPDRPGSGGAGMSGGQGGKKKMTVSEARSRLEEVESERLLSSEALTREAVRAAEQDGIVFIDEIDKIVEPGSGRVVSGGVSAEGVQRDLLPILEGCSVPTKHGNVSTEHVLFIASGAFHSAKPSDMLAELQGRLPIRVELKGLTADDFYRILTEPDNNMIRQQQELLATEGVSLSFTEPAVRAVSQLAEQANRLLDNIGARRLHTVLERVLADISYEAPEKAAAARVQGKDTYEYIVDEQLVHRKLDDLLKKQDLSRYIL